jgi:ElaB/YqjD/DUF883 family membrane-anchored ribosome-binding protein
MNETRSPDQIERDIADVRARISHTLDAVQDKLSPGQVLDQVLSYTKEEGGAIAEGCVRAVRQNPLPSALVGVGLAWLLYATNRPQAGSQAPVAPPPVRVDGVADMRARATELAKDQARAGLDWSKSQAERACEAGIDYVKRNPLGTTLIAAGLGAIVGALFLPKNGR